MNEHFNLLSHRFGWPTATTTVPIPPGLFQANYGPHGNELIRLEVPADKSIKAMKGVKVTGDPNVPFDKITFEIDAAGCLDIPMEKQRRCKSLKKFLNEPRYLDYQVTCVKWPLIQVYHAGWSRTRFHNARGYLG